MPAQRFRVNVSELQRRRLAHIQDPGTLEVPPPLSPEQLASARKERRTEWPTMPPWDSDPIDLTNELGAVGAGVTVLFLYRLRGGREGVVKQFGVGYCDSSLLPAPLPPPAVNISFRVLVNDKPVTPQEGLAWFPIFAPGPQDNHLTKITFGIRGGETVKIEVNNTTGLALDLWARVKGWHYSAADPR